RTSIGRKHLEELARVGTGRARQDVADRFVHAPGAVGRLANAEVRINEVQVAPAQVVVEVLDGDGHRISPARGASAPGVRMGTIRSPRRRTLATSGLLYWAGSVTRPSAPGTTSSMASTQSRKRGVLETSTRRCSPVMVGVGRPSRERGSTTGRISPCRFSTPI